MKKNMILVAAIDDDGVERIELEAEVPSIHVPALAPGQTARVEIGADREDDPDRRHDPEHLPATRAEAEWCGNRSSAAAIGRREAAVELGAVGGRVWREGFGHGEGQGCW